MYGDTYIPYVWWYIHNICMVIHTYCTYACAYTPLSIWTVVKWKLLGTENSITQLYLFIQYFIPSYVHVIRPAIMLSHKNYHIAGNFDGGKYWRIWHLASNPSKFSLSIFFNCIAKTGCLRDYPSIFSPAKISHYMVS